ncbi:MAG: ABC transporter ATP-binding protein, partial [Kiritimatiellae bacterium]|nr:ABC transporter ATP-binding protein [Kiritimatiellia bacterium]
MGHEKKPKAKLRRDDLRTFRRLLGFARPYAWRILVGGAASVVGGGSLIALFLLAQNLLTFLIDNNPRPHAEEEAPAAEAPAVPGPATEIHAEVAEVESHAEFAETAELSESHAEVAEAAEPPDHPTIGPSDHPTRSPDAAEPRRGFIDRMTHSVAGKMLDSEKNAMLEQAGVKGLLAIGVVMLLVIAVNSACQFLSMFFLGWVGQRVVMDLRLTVFRHLQELPVAFYNSNRAGDMISRVVADTQLLQSTVSSVLVDTIREPAKLFMVLAYVLLLEWRLALVALVAFPLVAVPIILIGQKLRRIGRDAQRRLADLTSVMKEALDGVAVVKAFGQEEREKARFGSLCRGFFRQMVRATKAKALNEPITHTIGGLGGLLVLVYAMVDRMPIERCVIFAACIWALYEPIKKIGRIAMEIQQSSGAADRIFEILDAPVTVHDAPDARPLADPLETLEFRDVAFSYGEKRVFDKLNLSLRAGESLAVVGPSGGGKTTLVSLLMRFFDPEGGAILRNGRDLRSATIASLRSRIGLVLQDTFLFNATIAENIAYGKPDATREEIEAAAKLAHAHEFILAKEKGYETPVGDRGVSLSGGQKQRLA